MIEAKAFISALHDAGVRFFSGVPDSLMSSFSAVLGDSDKSVKHIISACEGGAVSLAMGHHLATGRYGLVYMQNSGLGNALNPLASLAHGQVYKIPMILLIGWRGEPGQKDEPQHVKQGAITLSQLDLLNIPYQIIDGDSDIDGVVGAAFDQMENSSAPVAIVVKKGTFADYTATTKGSGLSDYSREQAISDILDYYGDESLVVSTTGKISREVYECREKKNQKCEDFLTVGGMGFASSIALGVALEQSDKRVLCIDGDGALLMHMGTLPIIGSQKPKNLVHFIVNNAMHESVGGQPTVAGDIDIRKIAVASGYCSVNQVSSHEALSAACQQTLAEDGPHLIEVQVKGGARSDLGRPKSPPVENKKAFMDKLGRDASV